MFSKKIRYEKENKIFCFFSKKKFFTSVGFTTEVRGGNNNSPPHLLFRVRSFKKEENTHVLQNSYLSTRIAIRFFLCALINFCALQATINVASNALNHRDIHLISSSVAASVARSTSDRSSCPSRVRSSSYKSSSSVRAFFSISASSESHRVFFVTTLPKIKEHFFCAQNQLNKNVTRVIWIGYCGLITKLIISVNKIFI